MHEMYTKNFVGDKSNCYKTQTITCNTWYHNEQAVYLTFKKKKLCTKSLVFDFFRNQNNNIATNFC